MAGAVGGTFRQTPGGPIGGLRSWFGIRGNVSAISGFAVHAIQIGELSMECGPGSVFVQTEGGLFCSINQWRYFFARASFRRWSLSRREILEGHWKGSRAMVVMVRPGLLRSWRRSLLSVDPRVPVMVQAAAGSVAPFQVAHF